jgi:hypothetical protein
MKIIRTDIFNRESRTDYLVASNIENKEEARIMLSALRDASSYDSSDWYVLVEDEYRLGRGMADVLGDIDENGNLV